LESRSHPGHTFCPDARHFESSRKREEYIAPAQKTERPFNSSLSTGTWNHPTAMGARIKIKKNSFPQLPYILPKLSGILHRHPLKGECE
jgi:hypothetical protein